MLERVDGGRARQSGFSRLLEERAEGQFKGNVLLILRGACASGCSVQNKMAHEKGETSPAKKILNEVLQKS